MSNDKGAKIEFIAHGIAVSGPKIDGGYKAGFEVDSSSQQLMALLVAIPQNTLVKVTVEPYVEPNKSAGTGEQNRTTPVVRVIR